MTETVPAGEQDGVATEFLPALKQSHAPFLPPEKNIFPPTTKFEGLAETAA
jgi:hypothetical protein